MDYRILGPLEVCRDGRTVRLGGDKQRALLAILLLHAGEVVSADRLIDGLWGERPPPTALKALQVHVSRLRSALERDGDAPSGGSDGVLVTRGHGYLLRVEAGELDLDRFSDLVEEGRRTLAEGDAARAAGLLREALGLWRGPPLADLAYEAFAQRPLAELEELRLIAVEERVEADLALGRHEQLVGELRALVGENPLRERLRGQLMLALYRCGREAEALEIYQAFRRGLAEELGLDPSPRLQRLETAILERDPVIEHSVASPQLAQAAMAARPPRRLATRRGRQRAAAAGLVLIAVAVAGAVLLSAGGGPSTIAADAVGALSPSSGSLSAVVPVGSSPSSMAAGGGAVWVANYNGDAVFRINPATDAVTEKIPSVSTPSGIAVGFHAVWVANNFEGTVSRIDPAVDKVVQPIPVGNGPSGVAVGYRSVWVTNSSDGTLSRIDPITDTARTIRLGGGATDVAVGERAVWVSDEANGRVLRVDPQTDQTQLIDLGGTGPSAITVGFGSVWVANSLDASVSRINPQTNTVEATIPVGNGPNAIAAGAGGVWVANEFGDTVARINPATDTVARTVEVGSSPRGLAIADGRVWVGVRASAAVHRGGALTVHVNAPFNGIDPAFYSSLASWLTISMTNDGLTAFKHVGGGDGAQVVPDLAVSLPAPTDGGLTYTFQLRRGIRYSTGAPVRPEDFRRAAERNLTLSGAVEGFELVIGGAACIAHPSRCDLSKGIVFDDAANTVTFHLAAPDPEFLQQLAGPNAVAVPPGTPENAYTTRPLPATGPYEVASYAPSRLVRLVRNPYFHQWSRAAQPDGYPDQIVWRIGASTSTALTMVEQNRADFTLDGPPPDRLHEVQTRFASRLNTNPNDVTIQLVLNTTVAPFNDLKVRRALSYAVDRGALARLLGQSSQPTCQLLPPGYIAGYQRYCPYTLNPDRAGAWRAPDLATAERLIAASHTRGMRIVVWSRPGYLTDFTAAGHYLVSLLDKLGYRASIKSFAADDGTFGRVYDPTQKVQAAFWVRTPAYPAASQFFRDFQCATDHPPGEANLNPSGFCDPRLEATMSEAFAAEGTNSPTYAQLWAKADRQITDQAPFVSFVTPSINDFVSRRVGNYTYNAEYGVLIDQLWLH